MDGAVYLFYWLFGLKHPSTKAYWLLGRTSSCGRMEASRRAHANECSPELLLPVSFSLQWATATPYLQRRPSSTSRYVFPNFLWGHCFFPWVLVHARPCGCPLRMEFLLLQSCGIPAIKPCWPSKSEPLEDPPPIDRPQVCEAWHGDQDFHSYGRTSVVSIFSSLWVTHLAGVGFYFIMIVPFLASRCGFFFVFGREVSFFGRFWHPPVDGCSTARYDFGALVVADEHMATYFAILNQKPGMWILNHGLQRSPQ